jgi:transposase
VTCVYIAAYFRRWIYQRETVTCSCGKCIVTAPCPDKLADRSPYSASFIAALTVQKCEDGLPIYRMEKQFERLGIPMARSTMTDLFHRGATLLAPISDRVLARIAAAEIVFADETSIKMQSSDKRAFVWTFLDDHFTGFVFSPTRSGDVPVAVLGESQGELMADLHTGYNAMNVLGRRRRAGCESPVRTFRGCLSLAADTEAARAALEREGRATPDELEAMRRETGDWTYQSFVELGPEHGFDRAAYAEHYRLDDPAQRTSDNGRAMDALLERLRSR